MPEFTGVRLIRRATFILIALFLPHVTCAASRSLEFYRSIIERNPFQLRPRKVPEKIALPPAPKAPEPEFFLTGITTVGFPRAPKRAYLVEKDPDPKHSTAFLTLSLGGRTSDPRLVEVDSKGRRIKINFHGEEMWLTMKQNSLPTAPTPATLQPTTALARNVPARFPTPRLN